MKNTQGETHRRIPVKTYLSDDEKRSFDELCTDANLTQAEFIRKAIFQAKLNIIVQPICPLDDLVTLNAEYGKIGSNLNQIAKFLNQGGSSTPMLRNELHQRLLDLYELKQKVLKMAGEFHGAD